MLPDSPLTRLVADIGGTNARFALYRGVELSNVVMMPCVDFPDLETAIKHYLSRVDPALPKPTEAGIAIAGPITSDVVAMTNHVWRFSASAIRRALGLDRLFVMNDFTALAMSLPYLPPNELEQVGHGHIDANSPVALIGPGTGLGVSGLIPIGEGASRIWVPLQGEGGHATMAPVNEREAAVVMHLRQRFSHVSAERLISGQGLINLYEALCRLEQAVPELLEPSGVTQRALQGTCRNCREALEMFCAMLGTVAGNLVLTLGARGGVYIGGGIVPKLGRMFAASAFRDRFEDKGRYSDYLADIPAFVIRTPIPAFIGLAYAFIAPGPRLEAG